MMVRKRGRGVEVAWAARFRGHGAVSSRLTPMLPNLEKEIVAKYQTFEGDEVIIVFTQM